MGPNPKAFHPKCIYLKLHWLGARRPVQLSITHPEHAKHLVSQTLLPGTMNLQVLRNCNLEVSPISPIAILSVDPVTLLTARTPPVRISHVSQSQALRIHRPSWRGRHLHRRYLCLHGRAQETMNPKQDSVEPVIIGFMGLRAYGLGAYSVRDVAVMVSRLRFEGCRSIALRLRLWLPPNFQMLQICQTLLGHLSDCIWSLEPWLEVLRSSMTLSRTRNLTEANCGKAPGR